MYVGEANKFPKLKGKAAEIKHLTAALLSTFEKHMDPTNVQHKHVKLVLVMACKLDEIIDAHPDEYRLPTAVSADFKKTCQVLVQGSAALGQHYHNLGIFLFHFTVKHHYLLHIAILSEFMNPRLGWCFAGEDMMHKVKTIYHGCHRGSPPHKAADKALQKYCQGLAICFLSNVWKK